MQKIQGTIIHGNKHGRTIGFPTTNIFMKAGTVEEGTYKVNVILEEKLYQGIASARNKLELFETHIFDFNEDIYGKIIEITILKKLRENRRFSSLEELKIQIQKDKEQAKDTTITAMVFGSFDLVHEGHKFFLSQAKTYCDTLVCIIATDYNIEKLKKKKPHFSQEARKEHIEELGIADTVKIGDEKNPMKWLEHYKPDVVCLGYDQIGFSKKLSETFPDIQVVRIDSYKEHIYKSSLLKQKK